jgi:hypothetical protein
MQHAAMLKNKPSMLAVGSAANVMGEKQASAAAAATRHK